MSNNSTGDRDRWEDLQVARLLFGLTPDEQAEYDRLDKLMPPDSRDKYEAVVAALDAAWATPVEPLPEHLRRAVRATAVRELAPTSASQARSWQWNQFVPWLVSAACLAIAVSTWLVNRPGTSVKPTAAQLRAELIAAEQELVQVSWTAGTTPIEGATGDVVWSQRQQRGFMRFSGLPVNSPTKEQYQLWIFAKNQSDKTPIDGGVFDIGSTGEVVVPIDAKLHVQDPFLFAVTIEQPGGVVVSSRERLPLLAKVE